MVYVSDETSFRLAVANLARISRVRDCSALGISLKGGRGTMRVVARSNSGCNPWTKTRDVRVSYRGTVTDHYGLRHGVTLLVQYNSFS